MPKKSKRRFFGSKSNKSKSAKLNRNASSSDRQQPESDSDDNASAPAGGGEEGDKRSIPGTSLVSSDSAPVMGQLESVANADNVSGTPKEEEQQNKTTIRLKVIQFIGELPSETRGSELESLRHGDEQKLVTSAEIIGIETDDNARENKSVIEGEIVGAITEQNLLHTESEAVGVVPKLDHKEESEKSDEAKRHQRECSFDDNYRVESPKQICPESDQRTKRHAILIQEISESSSSEEVKQFLDTEASALEMKLDKHNESNVATSSRHYRVESPESSDDNNNNKALVLRNDLMVQEISESSSSESVKNEILASFAKQTPTQPAEGKLILKIINIKELPSEEIMPSSSSAKMSTTAIVTTVPTSRINIPQYECKTEKKLNKAEEAILEALYGNKSLLQIPHLPLDVISEEGSDCGSDIDKQVSMKLACDELDDDVFLPLPSPDLSKKPPSSRQRLPQRREAEQPLLINTKIIETETNIPESCKSWETMSGDNELQAELVYLTSTSSSATDLSERGDITDTEDLEETSDETETNSLLESISVPSLDNIEHDMPIEIRISQYSPVYSTDYYQEVNEQKLADIVEEDEDQSPRSLEIIESQQQIEDVNRELHHLVTEHEAECQGRKSVERISEKKQQKEKEEEEPFQDQLVLENVPETTCDKIEDKRMSSENDKIKDDRMTPIHQFKRINSSDSSSSSNNSQCTIISQLTTDNQQCVDPLKDLCLQSLKENGLTLDDSGMTSDTNSEVKIIFQKKHNSTSRNAPQIPIINELELRYKCADDYLKGREKNQDKVITILQVPPEINYTSTSSMTNVDNERWLGLHSAQAPNLNIALSPLQESCVRNFQDSNTSADVLLDMHRKFLDRRAYHETYDSEDVENNDDSRQMNESRLERDTPMEDGYFGDRESSVENIGPSPTKVKGSLIVKSCESKSSEAKCDNGRDENVNILSCHEHEPTVKSAQGDFRMNSIRNCWLRDEFFKNTFTDASRDDGFLSNVPETFEVKKFELQNTLKRLDKERQELEEELKNIQSLQHFKREEFLFNEKKLRDKITNDFQTSERRSSNSSTKRASDDFTEFIYSNEKLQKELYNEWQDKVLERNERKMQKTIKITSITETIHQSDRLDRAASESSKVVPLENEFMRKLKERQKRLSLPFEFNSSTESLHHQNEEFKRSETLYDLSEAVHVLPAHVLEMLKYYEEEIAQSKNSDESGESKKTLAKPLLIGLIGVSMCLCGFYVGKLLTTQRSKMF